MNETLYNTSTFPSNDYDNDVSYYLQVENDYIFDYTYVRIIFILLYTIVFCLCFFGNLLVIVVVTMSRRLRSITNFFLANLALADFCVAIFCIYQNLFIYIVESWMLGEFLCKMYMFIQSLSNTASIFILVVICLERYFAIIYPISCKRILTARKLRVIIVCVWLMCILYSAPKFYWGNTVTVKTGGDDGNKSETVCVLNRQKYNSELFDMIHFVLLYVIPLVIMSLLYTRIAICLWKSSQLLRKELDASSHPKQSKKISTKEDASKLLQQTCSTSSSGGGGGGGGGSNYNSSSQNVLMARRGVVKMLIIVVCTFALCNLPFHVRKMWQYWSTNYHGNTNFSALLTPLTFLATYFNSAVNPLLYAFLSKNFRRGMKEILLCSSSGNYRNSLQMSTRRHNTLRSTIKTNATTVTIVNCSDGSHGL